MADLPELPQNVKDAISIGNTDTLVKLINEGYVPEPTDHVQNTDTRLLVSGYSGYVLVSDGVQSRWAAGGGGGSGVSGYSGFSGYSGQDGVIGHDGESGYSGFSGQDGIIGGDGPSGYSGYSGEAGTQYTWRGQWLPSTNYLENECVYNDAVGNGYVCLADHTSSATDEPGVGSGYSGYWDINVERGASGYSGFSGASPLPALPSGDGEYHLKILTGVASWVSAT